jgi:nitrogen fixation/metabolism regulation signal transduction histidine kinase
VTRIRRDLLKLVLALRNEDPSLRFSRDGKDPYFSAIHKGFNEIIRNFKLVRLDRASEQKFFEATINHIQFGIIAFHEDGKVELVNLSFLQLFELERIADISELQQVAPELPEWLSGLDHDDESFRKLNIRGTPFHLLFLASQMKILGRRVTLVSVRDISREIDQNELEAWQKLMRVLRHEILNSISPIKLLAGSIAASLDTKMSKEDVKELKNGLETIHRRATSLSGFMDAYSNLYRVPELELIECTPGKILQRISLIYKEECDRLGIRVSIKFNEDGQSIKLDPRLMEQVLMNLIKNAIEALTGIDNPALTLSARHEKGKAILIISDNGPGIAEDQLDHIFLPFYSTREGGTGVGLSFAQHVMRLHGGRIHVTSRPGEGSEFQLIFTQG